MQFIDQARIAVKAGRGGDGICAFRREKYVPAGGPSGGDGGRGGDVVLQADSNLQTLLDFKYKRLFQADDGRRGGPNRSTGASANTLLIRVPCGTEVRDLGTDLLLGDLIDNGEQLVIATGGKEAWAMPTTSATATEPRRNSPKARTEKSASCSWSSSCWQKWGWWGFPMPARAPDQRALGRPAQDCRLSLHHPGAQPGGGAPPQR